MPSNLAHGRGKTLWQYWVQGPGLARWAGSPKPWTTLVAALESEGVPPGQVKGLATNIYVKVKGHGPGQGKKR
jgi:hypothetical protein